MHVYWWDIKRQNVNIYVKYGLILLEQTQTIVHKVKKIKWTSILFTCWCCALFLRYIMCTHDLWFLHGRDVLFSMWSICCFLPIMSGNGLWLWRLIYLLDIWFVDDLCFALTFIYSLVLLLYWRIKIRFIYH